MKKQITLLVFILLSLSLQATGQDTKDMLPRLLGNAHTGTEFYLTFLPNYEEIYNENFLSLYIGSSTETEVIIEVPGRGLKKTITTIADSVYGCHFNSSWRPYGKYLSESPLEEFVFEGSAIHIVSQEPIIVYAVVDIKGTSEGYLALPVTMLGTEYIVSSYEGGNDPEWNLNSFTASVATQDETEAWFIMGGNEGSETAGGMAPGDQKPFDMNESDVVVVGAVGDFSDLTGSKWISNNPIAVVSGNFCAFVPSGTWACQHLIEMEIPVSKWGMTYPVTPIWSRNKPSILRVFACEDNTKIYRDNEQIGYIKQANGMQSNGWLEMRASDVNKVPRPVVISGDKPISVTQYNPGINDDNAMDTDPFQMNLLPPECFYNELSVLTPGIGGKEHFEKNYLNIIYQVDEEGKMPADLMFASYESGELVWKQLRQIVQDQGQEFDAEFNNKHWFSKSILLPTKGLFKLKAEDAFMAYSYGQSYYYCYGYPSGIGHASTADGDEQAPEVEWTMDCGGNVSGSAEDMPADEEIRENIGMVYMLSQESYNYEFSFNDYLQGQAPDINWTLKTIDPKQPARAELCFTDRIGNQKKEIIEYYPDLYELRYSTNFGRINVGRQETRNIWLVNLSDHDIEIEDISLKNSLQEFSLVLPEFPLVLPDRDSVQIVVNFSPDSCAVFIDSILIRDKCYETVMAGLSGHGVEPLIDITHYDFGTVRLGEHPKGEFSISNIGSGQLEIYDIIGPQGTEGIFSESLSAMLNGDTIRIDPGSHEDIEVSFAPQDTVLYSDSLIIISNTAHPQGLEIDSVAELKGIGWFDIAVNDSDDLQSQLSIQPSAVKPGGKTTLHFVARKSGKIDISMYDISGHLISVLNNSWYESGRHSCEIEAPMLSPGLYLLVVNSNGDTQNVRIIVE